MKYYLLANIIVHFLRELIWLKAWLEVMIEVPTIKMHISVQGKQKGTEILFKPKHQVR